MKSSLFTFKNLSLLLLSLLSITLLSSFVSTGEMSVDADTELPYVQITSFGTFYLPAEGGEIEISAIATQSASAINAFLMSKGVDYISVSGVSENTITLNVSPNDFGYEIIIAVRGRLGGSVRIVQEG